MTDDDLPADEAAWESYVRAVDLAGADPTDEHKVLVTQAYGALPGRGPKGRARAYMNEAIDVAVSRGKQDEAKVYVELSKSMLASSTGVPARVTKRLARYIEDVTALQLAYGLLVTNPPPDVEPLLEEGWLNNLHSEVYLAQQYRGWLLADPDFRGDEPAVTGVEKKAALISVGKAPTGVGRRPSTNANRQALGPAKAGRRKR